MDLEMVIQSEGSQKEKYHMLTHGCRIQKNGVDVLLCKAETETQTQRTKVWIPKWEVVGWWDGLGDWDSHTYTTMCKYTTNENLLGSTGNSTQCLGKKIQKREDICIYLAEIHFAVQQKLTYF